MVGIGKLKQLDEGFVERIPYQLNTSGSPGGNNEMIIFCYDFLYKLNQYNEMHLISLYQLFLRNHCTYVSLSGPNNGWF